MLMHNEYLYRYNSELEDGERYFCIKPKQCKASLTYHKDKKKVVVKDTHKHSATFKGDYTGVTKESVTFVKDGEGTPDVTAKNGQERKSPPPDDSEKKPSDDKQATAFSGDPVHSELSVKNTPALPKDRSSGREIAGTSLQKKTPDHRRRPDVRFKPVPKKSSCSFW